VPAAPPVIAVNTRPSADLSRVTCLPSSSIHPAGLKPKVIGTACWPCVRPAASMPAVRSARSAAAMSTPASSRSILRWASRSTRTSPVCVMFCVVAPQCTHPPCSPAAALSSVTKAISGWLDAAMPRSMRVMSRTASLAADSIATAAAAGMTPHSASATARAASTSSQHCQRCRLANSSRTPGSGTRPSVKRSATCPTNHQTRPQASKVARLHSLPRLTAAGGRTTIITTVA